jgi:hypothetical protein
MSPRVICGSVRRQWMILRWKFSIDSGSRSWSSSARARCSAATGSHGVPVVKPAFGAAAVHGIGVRQPSRPLNSGQKVMP